MSWFVRLVRAVFEIIGVVFESSLCRPDKTWLLCRRIDHWLSIDAQELMEFMAPTWVDIFQPKTPRRRYYSVFPKKPKLELIKGHLTSFRRFSLSRQLPTDSPNVWFNTWHFENLRVKTIVADRVVNRKTGALKKQIVDNTLLLI